MLSVNNFSFGSRVYLFFVLLLTVGIVESHAQYYSFAHYSIEDGLPQSSVNHIAQDQFGYLWIATSGGLSRFDGQNFENFGMQEGLSSSYITHILTTSTQQLAIATYSGLTIYDGHTFTPYSISNGEGKLLEVRQVFEHTDGRLLLLLPQNQLAFWSADTIEMIPVSSLLEEKYITGVVQNPDGTYWATTYDGDLLRFDGAAFELIPTSHPSKPNFNGLYRDSSGKIWLMGEQEIYTFQQDDTVFTKYEFSEKTRGLIFTLTEDEQGRMWVATSNGVFCFRPETGMVDLKSYGLEGSVVRDIFKDREGNLWFGSFDEGMYKFRGETFTYLHTEHGLSEKSIFSIYRDSRDDYWFSYLQGGVDRYDGENFYHYGYQDGLPNEFIQGIVEDSVGNMWLGSPYGLIRYDGESFTTVPSDGMPHSRVISAYKDQDNHLWFGTKKGAVRYENGNFVPLNKKAYQCQNSVTIIRQLDDKRIVFGTGDGVYLEEDGEMLPLLAAEHEAQNQYILSMTQDLHQNLWFSTLNGLLYRYHLPTKEIAAVHKQVNAPPGVIYTMDLDYNGNLVMGTQRGVYQLILDSKGNASKMLSYNKNDGFLGMEANANASFVEDDGNSIWIGTVDGAYKFKPNCRDLAQSMPIIPHLTGIQLQYQPVDWGQIVDSVQAWFQIPINLELSYRQNHIIFSYLAVSLTNSDKVRYQFRLKNFDEAWSPITQRTEAVYANVPPGDYVFQVRARSARGVWSSPVEFPLLVAPPFWQTWWFYLALGILIVILIRVYALWNLRNERKRRKELQLEVRKRTREIQNLNENLEERVHQRTYELEASTRKLAEEIDLRKQHQERIVRQEREYRLLVNNLREVIFKSDLKGKFTFVNHRWEEFTGYSVEESLGKQFLFILHPEEQIRHKEFHQQMLNGTLPFIEDELRIVKKDGTIGWGKVSARIEQDEEGNMSGLSGSLIDIDQRKRAEFALRGSEEKYRFLAENTQDIITLQDLNMQYTYVSPRIREVAGHEPETLLGKTSFEFLHPEDRSRYHEFRQEVLQKRTIISTTLRFLTKEGVYHYYETSLKPILDENRRIVHFISSSRDVTEKVKLTQEIEKVREKVAQDFHDEMGNNLASISVLSQIIQNKLGQQTNGIGSLLTKIDTASKNLFYGTRDFIWAIDPKNDNVQEVYFNLKDFGDELFENTGVTFLANFEPCEGQHSLKLPSGWSRQIVLIFKEALTNALKYANADTVQLEFRVCDDAFEATLLDDGVGFDLHSFQQSFRGIRNMKDRAKKINVDLTLNSVCKRGTKVELKGKITQNGV